MSPKNTVASLLLVLFVVSLFTTANASPRNKNSTAKQITKSELNAARLLAQKTELEAAYKHLLIKNNNTRVQVKNNLKARQIKVSLKPETKFSDSDYDQRLNVTATAYTSHVNQTDSTPNIAAWGDRLKPGMKAIAVSRDLLKVYGLKHKQKVRIKGLKGEYVVLDKMNKRWRKKIDIYMGMNKRKALRWGRRKVEILWN